MELFLLGASVIENKKKFVSYQDVCENISIEEVASEHGIELSYAGSGRYSHKCKCPSVNHKGGDERTPSCYINTDDNKFNCFGCGEHGSVVGFHMLCTEQEFGKSLKDLKEVIRGRGYRPSIKSLQRNTSNFFIQIEISKLFREHMHHFKDDQEWMDHIMKGVDTAFRDIGDKDIPKAKKVLEQIKILFRERYS